MAVDIDLGGEMFSRPQIVILCFRADLDIRPELLFTSGEGSCYI
jgi:hypothetical protein